MSSCGNEPKEQAFTENDVQDLTGYVTIVTGGNSGIGYETALQLALRNARVYIAGRSEERVNKAIEQMNQAAEGKKLDLQFLQVDLMSLKSCKEAATMFTYQESRLDILINNAGIMTVPYELTVDGFERQFQVNYLAPFVFTSTLLPLLLSTAAKASTPHRVRVVNVSSDLAFNGGPKGMHWDDFNMTNEKGMLELVKRYGHSKQASIRHAKELNDRYSRQGVTAYSLHPGIVKSNLQGGDPGLVGTVMRTMMKVGARTTPLEGARNSLFCATSPDAPIKGQGRFFLPVAKLAPKVDNWLDDREGNARLWQASEAIMVRIG